MTLFTLLIVMALERISAKSPQFHIATLAHQYFDLLSKREWLKDNTSALACVFIAAVPAVLIYIVVSYLPGVLAFFFYLFALWVCLGCPVTRKTYKRYLQAANREDFEACSLYSESFGNKGGALSEVGKQLVLVNYRQYASVIIFFVFFGVAGMVFYSVAKELYFYMRNKQAASTLTDEADSTDSKTSDAIASLAAKNVLHILDIIPVRITAFGFLLVGHFSKGLSAWLDVLFQYKLDAYDLLANVAKASEEMGPCENPYLDEALQMVKLVKRNIVFILMAVSVMTLVGVVA